MHTPLLVLLSLAPSILAAPAEVEVVHIREITQRQSIPSVDLGDLSDLLATQTAIPSACLAMTDLSPPPTPPADVVSALQDGTDPCSLSGDAQEDFFSYESEFDAWWSTAEQEYKDAVSACPLATLAPTGSFTQTERLFGSLSCRPAAAKETGGAMPKATALAAVAGVWAGVAGVVAVL